jgi:hypothetical protein
MVTHSPLRAVDFFNSVDEPRPGLVDVHSQDLVHLSIDERSAIRDALFFEDIDFVFFRRFSDGRSSQVSAYIIDNTEERLDEQRLVELHREIWLHGTAPLLYVAWPSRIDILACVRQPDFWRSSDQTYQYNPAERLEINPMKTAAAISSELKRFSALRLSDGTFWEEPNNNELVQHERAAHQLLIQAVVDADSQLNGEQQPLLRRLLLLMVLIKYLEDRDVFPDNWFDGFHRGAKNFFDILQHGDPGEVGLLLRALEGRFNGDLFALPRGVLDRNILDKFAVLAEARTIKQQGYLWRQFSFKHLPVEIISHLYQRFVNRGSGTVYTPPFLASLLLDQAMPYSTLTGQERVIDPACGSGIFLVGAFRRLINIWRNNNGWRQPDVQILKKILRRSIYGIDVDRDAIDLTAFSLSLAICDALQPDVIWRDLKFDPLHESNLLKADFFRVTRDFLVGKPTPLKEPFDVVIGNPPFESKLSEDGREVDLIIQRQDPWRGSIPDKQAAYLFLEQAFTIVRPKGTVCLIQPSALFYKSGTRDFRANIHSKYKIETMLDFTSIRGLYDKADVKTIAVLAKAIASSENDWIRHWTFRRTVSARERICFELDHYDRHRVSYLEAVTRSSVWRENLLGGGRLSEVSKRLQNGRTLSQYVKSRGWDYGEGFVAGGKKVKRTAARFLTGKPFLPTEAFTDNGIDESRISVVKETEFRSAYTPARYSDPLILIKETDTLPVALWENGFIAYKAKIVGISAPKRDLSDLRELYNTVRQRRNVYQFFCAINSIQTLIDKATAICKQDIDVLPYPADKTALSMSFWEEALCEDTLKYMTKYVRLGQKSELLRKQVQRSDLRKYADMFVRLLGSVYENLHSSEPIFFDGLTCQPFYFGPSPDLQSLLAENGEEFRNLVYGDDKHGVLRTVRVLRIYAENTLILVKPDRLRYWIRSTAIRDSDETLYELRRQGY